MEQKNLSLQRPDLCGNTNTGFLKTVALIFMIIDHTAVVFFPGSLDLRLLGRIAFPIYAWCGVVGCIYTSDHRRYLTRLLLFTVISQPFYMMALNHAWYQLNVFATLLCGQLAITGIRLKWHGSQFWAPVLCILLACMIKMDYGWKGVLVIILMYMARGSASGLAATMIAFCLFWGEGTSQLHTVFGIPLKGLKTLTPYGSSLYTAVLRLENFAVLSLPFILIPMGWRKKMPKWLAYAAYPGHLAILWVLKLILK